MATEEYEQTPFYFRAFWIIHSWMIPVYEDTRVTKRSTQSCSVVGHITFKIGALSLYPRLLMNGTTKARVETTSLNQLS